MALPDKEIDLQAPLQIFELKGLFERWQHQQPARHAHAFYFSQYGFVLAADEQHSAFVLEVLEPIDRFDTVGFTEREV